MDNERNSLNVISMFFNGAYSNIMRNTPFNAKLPAYLPLKKVLAKLALGLATLLVVAGVWVATPTAQAAEIEPLHGITVTSRYCTIAVTSNGCTQKEDFVSILKKTEPPVVTFIRLKPDYCKAPSRPTEIRFSLSEVGAETFAVANVFSPAPGY